VSDIVGSLIIKYLTFLYKMKDSVSLVFYNPLDIFHYNKRQDLVEKISKKYKIHYKRPCYTLSNNKRLKIIDIYQGFIS